MRKYVGKGVYGAIAIGKASIFKRQEVSVRRNRITDTQNEISRFENAKTISLTQLEKIHDKALREVGESNAQIFEIHMMMIEDDDYNESVKNIIETQLVNAEYAVAVTSDNFAEMFRSTEDSYMQARAADVKDISNRIIKNMVSGKSETNEISEKTIVCFIV